MEKYPLKMKKQYSKLCFTPKSFHRGDLFSITMNIKLTAICLLTINKYHSRFIVQVGHETMYAGLENHIFYLEL